MNLGLSIGLLSELFLRPLAIWILLLPLLLWILTRIQPRPELRFTGAFKFWRFQQAHESASAKRRRAPLRPVMFLVLLALTLGALGLLGVLRKSQLSPITWRVLVDSSPSMLLPASGPEPAGRSRMALGVSQAWSALQGIAGPLDSVEWQIWPLDPVLLDLDKLPDLDWIERQALQRAADDLPFHFTASSDLAGTFWVTDRIPDFQPAQAGLIAVGGAAVPGCIALDGARRVDWDGQGLVESDQAAPIRRVRIDVRGGSSSSQVELQNPLKELFLLWARQRHYELASDEDPSPDLVLSFGPRLDSDMDCSASSGRWSLSGKGAALLLEAETSGQRDRPWLQGWANGQPGALMVTARPGLIRLAWSTLEPARGSQTAFALDWSELFDRCLGASPGVISLAERRSAGPALQRAAERPQSEDKGPGNQEPWSSWLAAAAAVLGLTALAWDHAGG